MQLRGLTSQELRSSKDLLLDNPYRCAFDDNVARDKYEKSVQAAIMDIRSMMNGTDYA